MTEIRYISFGAGVQSTALLAMSCKGDNGVPRADVAIFADTGDEPGWVYETLKFYQSWSTIPVVVVRHGHLSEDIKRRLRGEKRSAPAIPLFTNGKNGHTMLRRHCTTDYKINPIRREVRRRVGRKGNAIAMIGISLDEAHRVKDSRDRWIVNTYPLIEARLNRTDCMAYIERLGLPVPLKSSCVFCPYHSDDYWRMLAEKHPVEFQRAIVYDEGFRDMSPTGIMSETFLHRSCRPLSKVDLAESPDLFGNECEGVCGV